MVTKNLMRLGPDLIYGPSPSPSTASSTRNTTGGGSSTRHKKRKDPIFTYAFQDLLRISPDIFELDDLLSKKPVPAKGEGLSKGKNTTGPVKSGLGMVEEGREEEILDDRISSRGSIIRNTRKM